MIPPEAVAEPPPASFFALPDLLFPPVVFVGVVVVFVGVVLLVGVVLAEVVVVRAGAVVVRVTVTVLMLDAVDADEAADEDRTGDEAGVFWTLRVAAEPLRVDATGGGALAAALMTGGAADGADAEPCESAARWLEAEI